MSSIELSKLVSKKKKKSNAGKGRVLNIDITGSLSPELNIVILREDK